MLELVLATLCDADVSRLANTLFFQLSAGECATVERDESIPPFDLIICKERVCSRHYHVAVYYQLKNGNQYFDKNYRGTIEVR